MDRRDAIKAIAATCVVGLSAKTTNPALGSDKPIVRINGVPVLPGGTVEDEKGFWSLAEDGVTLGWQPKEGTDGCGCALIE